MSREEARARFRAAVANMGVRQLFAGQAVPVAVGAFATGAALGMMPDAPSIFVQQLPRLLGVLSGRA